MGTASRSATLPDSTHGDPRGGVDILARAPEGPSLRRRRKAAPMRALRPRGCMARTADVPDPRSHQRCPDRQPDREPADRVPELRRHARDPLRPQEPARARAARMPVLRDGVHPKVPDAPLLHAAMRQPQQRHAGAEARTTQGHPAVVWAAAVGARGHELRCGRAQVRGLRQRSSEMAPLLQGRGRGGTGDRRRVRPGSPTAAWSRRERNTRSGRAARDRCERRSCSTSQSSSAG